MDWGLIITAIAALIAGISAIAALIQARAADRALVNARSARDAAAKHERAALDAAGRAATASERSAAAHERQVELLEESAARDPWSIEWLGQFEWKLTNQSGMLLEDIFIEGDPEDVHVQGHPTGDVATVPNGGAVRFHFVPDQSSSGHTNVSLHWVDPLQGRAAKQMFSVP